MSWLSLHHEWIMRGVMLTVIVMHVRPEQRVMAIAAAIALGLVFAAIPWARW